MKSVVITLLLLVGLSGAATAQMQDRHAELPGQAEPSAARVAEVTRQMCNTLHLNEAQYIRLRTVNQAKLMKLDEISWQYSGNVAERQTRLSELEAQYELDCSRILTPSQLSLLRAEQQQHDAQPAKADPTEGGLG